jgi:chromosome partitioning protein
MPVVAVVNRKGGSGKSTLATHLAAYCAHEGLQVMLGDVDRQQSSQGWLRVRQAQPLKGVPILGWTVDPKNVLRAPAGVTHVVLDTPGGMRGFELARIVGYADAILMPLCNSVFDRQSAAECYAELKTLPRVASGRCKVAAIGMRIDGRTKSAAVLKEWAQQIGVPFIGVLRETQAYVRCIERGLTLFDLPSAQVQCDLAQWEPIVQWLKPVLTAKTRALEAQQNKQGRAAPGAAPTDLAPAIPKLLLQPNTEQPADEHAAARMSERVIERAREAAVQTARSAQPARSIDSAVRGQTRTEIEGAAAIAYTHTAPKSAAPKTIAREFANPALAKPVAVPSVAKQNAASARRATPARSSTGRPTLNASMLIRTKPARAGFAARLGRLLDALLLRRLLQRNSGR